MDRSLSTTPARALRDVSASAWVDALVAVASPDVVTSPWTGARGAAIVLELCERATTGLWRSLGRVCLGDTLVLREGGGQEVVLVARRAELVGPAAMPEPMLVKDALPTELVALLPRASGGTLGVREHVVRERDWVRLRAVVERPGDGARLVVRHDEGAVSVLERLAR